MIRRVFVSLMGVAISTYAGVALALPNCIASNRVAVENYPGASSINTTNNLLLPSGKAVEAEGQKLIVTGQIVDTSCAPVAEAVVELWQNNPYGRWVLATGADLSNAKPTFAGAGRTYTDADGRFTFITAFPAPTIYKTYNKKGRAVTEQRAPFINIKIKKDKLSDFTTALFFANDQRNETDKVLKKLTAKTREDVTMKMELDQNENVVGTIKIVLPAKVPYRTY